MTLSRGQVLMSSHPATEIGRTSEICSVDLFFYKLVRVGFGRHFCFIYAEERQDVGKDGFLRVPIS